ncbi:MAG TPA: hypothetical protein VER33_13070, partial [Polyangiaceae bacterium]|nr:hypothetical protein [Polyangiaceae bacterium]
KDEAKMTRRSSLAVATGGLAVSAGDVIVRAHSLCPLAPPGGRLENFVCVARRSACVRVQRSVPPC